MATKQETFERMAEHLLDQGEKSHHVPNEGSATIECLYRKFRGELPPLKCAVGILIPDELYDRRMEGQNATEGGLVTDLLEKDGHDLSLCQRVQRIHDDNPPDTWLRMLQEVAADESLEMPMKYRFYCRNSARGGDTGGADESSPYSPVTP